MNIPICATACCFIKCFACMGRCRLMTTRTNRARMIHTRETTLGGVWDIWEDVMASSRTGRNVQMLCAKTEDAQRKAALQLVIFARHRARYYRSTCRTPNVACRAARCLMNHAWSRCVGRHVWLTTDEPTELGHETIADGDDG